MTCRWHPARSHQCHAVPGLATVPSRRTCRSARAGAHRLLSRCGAGLPSFWSSAAPRKRWRSRRREGAALSELGFLAPTEWGEVARAKPETERGNGSASMNSGGTGERRAAPSPTASRPPCRGEPRVSPVLRTPRFAGARKWRRRYPAIAIGTALLLGIWISISSVDMVSPRSIETCR